MTPAATISAREWASCPDCLAPSTGRGGGYQLVETTIPGQEGKDEASLFDGIDTSLSSLAEFAGQTPPDALTSGLAAIADAARRAREAFDAGDDDATAAPIEAGLTAVRALRARLNSMGLDETARYEIDFRLQNEEEDFEDAVLAAHGLSLQAVADDGLVVGGQPIRGDAPGREPRSFRCDAQ